MIINLMKSDRISLKASLLTTLFCSCPFLVLTFVLESRTTPYTAFIGSRSQNTRRCQESIRLWSLNTGSGHDEEGTLQYDDFGDFIPSTKSEPPIVFNDMDTRFNTDDEDDVNMNFVQLSKLVAESYEKRVEREDRIAKNWLNGNWKVRGFSLDKFMYDPSTVAKINSTGVALDSSHNSSSIDLPEQVTLLSSPRLRRRDELGSGRKEEKVGMSQPIHISKIALDITDVDEDHDDAGDLTENDFIVVGRTDGSICLVQLGSQTLTKFIGVPKLVMKENTDLSVESNDLESSQDSPSSSTVRLERDFISDDQMVKNRRRDIVGQSKEEDIHEMNSNDIIEEEGTPFQVLLSFQAHEANEPVTALLLIDDILCTAAGTSGEIKVWKIEERKDHEAVLHNRLCVIPWKNLSVAHNDKIIALKSLSSNNEMSRDHDIVLSASIDGSFALWELSSGDLICRSQINVNSHEIEQVSINCVDVQNHIIFLGLTSGQVLAYDSRQLIHAAGFGKEQPLPLCCFPSLSRSNHHGNAGGITAIKCMGRGNLKNVDNSKPSGDTFSVLTGGADGSIKQWELISRFVSSADSSEKVVKLEYWPRLSTQRLKHRAHIFKSAHSRPVSALAYTKTVIISAGQDGSVIISSPLTGDELYRMDGFSESISSLCLDHGTLITDGMKEFVAVHDFDTNDDEFDSSYELD